MVCNETVQMVCCLFASNEILRAIDCFCSKSEGRTTFLGV